MGAMCAADATIELVASHEQCIQAWNDPGFPDSRPQLAASVAQVEITPFSHWSGEVELYQCAFDFFTSDGEPTDRALATGNSRPDAEQFRMRFIPASSAANSLRTLDEGEAELLGESVTFPFREGEIDASMLDS